MKPEIKAVLERPFKKTEIKKRDGGFGKMLSYVEGHAVIARLNEAFDSTWDFGIIAHTIIDDHLVVQVKLTVNLEGQYVSKEAYGGKKLTKTREKEVMKNGVKTIIPPGYLDLGNDFKAASTDALKKAATLFGVALDLYSDDVEDDEPAKPTTKAEPKSADEDKVEDATASQPANIGQKSAINNLVKKSGKNLDEVLKKLSIKSFDSLTAGEAGKIITELQAK